VGGKGNSIASAAIGAVAALALVVVLGFLIRAPLTRVPENTLKFVVGIMLTSFGTFWGGEGLGIKWRFEDVFILFLVAIYLALSGALILWLRPYGTRRKASVAPASGPAIDSADAARSVAP
jgi:uncharacterized membrane protein